MTLAPRAVIVHRRSELDELLARHGTRGQAEFFLRTRGRDLADVQLRHDELADALLAVQAGVPYGWRTATVERAELDRFEADERDVVIAIGQDGLVANVAKYVVGRPVIGVAPAVPGLLMRHTADDVAGLLRAGAPGWSVTALAMVEARTDDGQRLTALNEIYVGHASHQSARYVLQAPGVAEGERQSSSGLIVGTGTGATGWCASLAHDRGGRVPLPDQAQRAAAWFVREAWPSPQTAVAHTSGWLAGEEEVRLVVESDQLVAFGDGIETDRLRIAWGQRIDIALSARTLDLVV